MDQIVTETSSNHAFTTIDFKVIVSSIIEKMGRCEIFRGILSKYGSTSADTHSALMMDSQKMILL